MYKVSEQLLLRKIASRLGLGFGLGSGLVLRLGEFSLGAVVPETMDR